MQNMRSVTSVPVVRQHIRLRLRLSIGPLLIGVIQLLKPVPHSTGARSIGALHIAIPLLLQLPLALSIGVPSIGALHIAILRLLPLRLLPLALSTGVPSTGVQPMPTPQRLPSFGRPSTCVVEMPLPPQAAAYPARRRRDPLRRQLGTQLC